MKKLVLLIAFVLPMLFGAFAQVEDVDAQLFGSRRNTKQYNVHDFGTISEIVKHDFIIKNSSVTPITVVEIKAPEGFEVIIAENTIKPQSVSTFTVVIDPEKVNIEGDFEQIITVVTQYEDALGLKTKEINYTVKGKF